MSRYRLVPTREQEAVLISHCAHARYVWNLAVEQQSWWHRGRKSAPGYLEQARQLTVARAEFPWLRSGSHMVQQQALRDFAQAMANFFAGTHRRPTWRKAGRNEGFRVVGLGPANLCRLNRNWGAVKVPKVGWVRFRWSRAVPAGVKSFRVTRDRVGRWHLAFATLPAPIPAPRNGLVVGVDRGIKVSAALSTGEKLNVPGLSSSEQRRLLTLERKLARGTNVAQKTGLNRGISRAGWGKLVTRLEEKAPGRVEKIPPAYTSRRCSACGHVDKDSRESQALFRCTACGHTLNADINAARNIAAGHAVKARGGDRNAGPANREPQRDLLAS